MPMGLPPLVPAGHRRVCDARLLSQTGLRAVELRVWGLEFGILGLEFWVWGLEVWGLEFRIWSFTV